VRSNSNDRALPLLQIDDSPDDRHLVEQAIFLTNTQFKFHGAASFEDALPYFQSHGDEGEQQEFPCPALVLLDYDLGKSKGTDFLYWLRVMKKMPTVQVVVFSGSANQDDIEDCYANGANHFLSKPNDLTRLKAIVRSLHLSLSILKLPDPLALLPEYQPDPREHPSIPALLPMPAAVSNADKCWRTKRPTNNFLGRVGNWF
jgi:CheY-like chemotaxis protein